MEVIHMICPHCFHDDVSPVGDTHYICNNPDCRDENGNKTQFRIIMDDWIHFPYNIIFSTHNVNEFYRDKYVVRNTVGNGQLI